MNSLSNPTENQHRMNTQAEQTRGGNSQKLNGNNIGEMHHSWKIDSVKLIHSSPLSENNKQLQSNNVHPSNTSQHHNATTLKSKRPELCRAYEKVHSNGGSLEQVEAPCTLSLPKSCLRSKGNHSDLTNEYVVFSANVNGYPHENLHQSLSTSGNETQYLKIGTSQEFITSDESSSALNNADKKNSYRERACNPRESGTFKLTSGLHSVNNSTSNRDQNVARPRYPFVSRDYVLFRNPTVNEKFESNACLKKPFRLNGYHRLHDHVPTELHSHEQPANQSCIYSQLNSSENVSAPAALQMPVKYNNSSVRSTEISVSSQISNASNKSDTCGSSDVLLRDCNGRYFISASLELSSISSRGAAKNPQSEVSVTNSYAKLLKTPNMSNSVQSRKKLVAQESVCVNDSSIGAHTTSKCKRSVDNSYPDSSNELGCKQQLPSCDKESGDGEILKQAFENSAQMLTEQTNLEEKSNRTQLFYVGNGSPMMKNTVKNGNPLPSLFKSPSSLPTSDQYKVHLDSETNACVNGRHPFGAYTKSTCKRSVGNSYPDSSNELGCKQQLPSRDKESGDGEILKQAFENSAQMLTEQTNLEEKSNRTQLFYVGNGSPMMINTVKNGNPLPSLFKSPSSLPTSDQYKVHLDSETNACVNGRHPFGAYTKSTCKRSVGKSYPDSSNELGCKQQLPSCDKESGDGEILKQAFENFAQMLTEQTNLEEESNRAQLFYVRNCSPMMNNTVKNGNPSPLLFKSPSSMPNSGQRNLHFVSQTNACLNGRHPFGAYTKSTCKRSVGNSYPDSSNELGCKQQLPSCDKESGDGEILKQAFENFAQMLSEQTNLEEESNRAHLFYVRNGSPMMNNTVKNGNPLPSLFKSPSSLPTSDQYKVHLDSETNACVNGRNTFGAYTKSTCKRSVGNSYPDSSNELGCKQQLPSCDKESGDGEILKQAFENSAQMLTEQTNLEEKSNGTQLFYVGNGSPMMNNTVKNGNPLPSLFKSPSSLPTSDQYKVHLDSETNACVNGRNTFGAYTKSTCKRSVGNSYPDSSNELGCKQQLPSCDKESGDGEILKQAFENSAQMLTEQTNLEEKSNRTQLFYVGNGSPMMNNTVKNGNHLPSLFKSPSSLPTSDQYKVHLDSETKACVNGRNTFGAYTKSTCKRSVDNSYPDSSNELGCKQQLPSCDKESGDGEVVKQASGKRMKLFHKKDSSVGRKIVENEKKVPEKQQPVLNSIFLHKTCGKNSDDSSSRKDKIVMKDHVKRWDKKPKRVTFQIDHDNTHEFAGKQEKPTSSSTVNESNVTMKSENKKQSPEIPEEEQKGGSNTKQSKGENEIPKEERSKKSPKHTIYYEGDIPLKIPILKLHKLDQATVDAYTKGPQKKNADFQQQITCGSKRRKITPPKKRVQQCKNYNAASVLEGASSIKNKQSDICRSNAGAKERENENGRRMEDKVPEGSSIKKINTQHLRKMMYIVARNKNTDFDKFLSETIGLSIDKQKAHSEPAKKNINTSESKVSDATNKLLDVEGLDLNSDETTGGSSSIETSGPSKTVISLEKEVGENRNSKRIQKRCEVCWQNVENVADHIINAHAEVFL